VHAGALGARVRTAGKHGSQGCLSGVMLPVSVAGAQQRKARPWPALHAALGAQLSLQQAHKVPMHIRVLRHRDAAVTTLLLVEITCRARLSLLNTTLPANVLGMFGRFGHACGLCHAVVSLRPAEW
jgi:hypothetical protein